MSQSDQPHPGLYARLDDLVALEHRARGFSFLPHQPVRSLLGGAHASRLRGRGLDFEEIRRYLPGDDIRAIDWKVTARTRQPHTRVYTEERERPMLLLVDQRLGMFFGSRVLLKSVAAAELAALAAWRSIAVKDRVGALVFGDASIREVPPRRSRANVMQILRAVVDQNHALHADSDQPTNPGQLNEVLRHARRLAPHDFLVCLITDAAGSDAETARLATTIARHNDLVVAFVFDPLEADLPDAGLLIASDGSRQLDFDSGDRSLRDGFREAFARRRAQARQFLLRREVAVLPINTEEAVDRQILRLLGSAPRPAGGQGG